MPKLFLYVNYRQLFLALISYLQLYSIYIYKLLLTYLGPKWFKWCPAFLHLWNVLGFDLFSLSAPHKLAFWCFRQRTQGWWKAAMMDMMAYATRRLIFVQLESSNEYRSLQGQKFTTKKTTMIMQKRIKTSYFTQFFPSFFNMFFLTQKWCFT